MTKDDMLDELLRGLLEEGWADSRTAIPEDAASQRHLLRTLMNSRIYSVRLGALRKQIGAFCQ
jgi:hypothetical protein